MNDVEALKDALRDIRTRIENALWSGTPGITEAAIESLDVIQHALEGFGYA